MSTDFTEVYRSLDPLAPLEPDSELYVERPDNPMDRLALDLRLSDRPRHYLLAGHRGTGKTTELRRLSYALGRDREVVTVDVGESTKLATADSEEILSEALRRSYYRRNQDVKDLVSVQSVDQWTRKLTGYGSQTGRDLLHEALSGGGRPILVVLDGLERFERDEDILRVLTRPTPVHGWPVSVICTIPLSLYLSDVLGEYARYFDRSIFLPGIAPFNRNGTISDYGVQSLASIVHRRVGKRAFTPEALQVVATSSAGIHRELLQLAQRACVVAALEGATEISVAHAEAAIAEQRNEYSVVVRSSDYLVLKDVRRLQQLQAGAKTARLLRNQLIVAYANGTTWFDIHPILGPLLGPEEAS